MSIDINNLSYTYESDGRQIQALKNINCTINEGEFVCLMGQTGSGKSTLLQHLNGLLSAQSGDIKVDNIGFDNASSRKKIRLKVGMAFQFPERQLFEQSVEEDIAYGPKNHEFDEDQIKKSVERAMELVGLDVQKYSKLSPFELSGGEQRRVALAGVLATNPKYLVLDEPTCGLDPLGTKNMVEVIKNLHTNGMTIIMSSHDIDAIGELASRVIVLDKGKIVLDGTPEKIFSDESKIVSLGLDVPYAIHFQNKLRQACIEFDNTYLTLNDLAQAIANLANNKVQKDLLGHE